MAMNTNLMIASGLSGLSVLLLLGLTTVWVRNYRTFRTPLTLGLIAFASVLLVENLLAIYFFLAPGCSTPGTPSPSGRSCRCGRSSCSRSASSRT